jgi:predicted component of type VI protein secretion system
MVVELVVQSFEGQRVVPPISARFGAEGGTIGRGERATLRLNDPGRTMSREHARVLLADGRATIENIGSGNDIVVAGRAVPAGARSPLADGDVIEIGAYRLGVQLHQADGDQTVAAGAGAAAVPDDVPLTALVAAVHASNLAAQQAQPARKADVLPAIAVPPTEVRAHLPPAPPMAPPADAAERAASEAMWQAFAKGVGVEIDAPERVRPQLMTTLGAMVRTMVDGLRELVQLRAHAKAAFQAERTQIQRRDNNPLKFSRDTDGALKALLAPPRPGFMPGPAAIEDALRDLQIHQSATMAGMQAAHDALVAQFSPEQIERRLSKGGLLDALVPSRRHAQLWELYVAQYRALQQEAARHSDQVFESAFLAAYERETAAQEEAAKLKKLRRVDSTISREIGR